MYMYIYIYIYIHMNIYIYIDIVQGASFVYTVLGIGSAEPAHVAHALF